MILAKFRLDNSLPGLGMMLEFGKSGRGGTPGVGMGGFEPEEPLPPELLGIKSDPGKSGRGGTIELGIFGRKDIIFTPYFLLNVWQIKQMTPDKQRS